MTDIPKATVNTLAVFIPAQPFAGHPDFREEWKVE